MACGLPVVAVNRGAAPDRVAGSGAGELYEHDHPASCARALLRMACRLAVLPLLVTPLLADPPSAALLGDLILRPFFVLYATALLPLPGGGGGVELTVAAALAGVLAPATLGVTLLWWRVYTFYLSALAGGLMLLRPKRN